MGFVRSWLPAVAFLALAGNATAQTTNGTISGHVSDAQGLALPGVTVTASSPNLQGVRTLITSENGDYIIPLLPPGVYTLSFELSGFEKVTKEGTLAPTQTLPIDASLGIASVAVTVNVVGRAADILTQTAQVATNFKQDLIATLPTNRDINAVLLMAPAVHGSGPSGNFSIAGAMSFESLYMVNGVNVNENIRGQANSLYIEDAVQETTVATAGVSAEFGRFTGGVVNVITKSGGNTFSGSFRDTLNNDNWRSYTLLPSGAAVPNNRTQIVPNAVLACGVNATDPCEDGAQYPRDSRLNVTVPTYEYTLGGPVMKDHLWFFGAGRDTSQQSSRQLAAPVNTSYPFTDTQHRYEGKLTYSFNANQRFQGAYTKIMRDFQNNGGTQFLVLDSNSLYNSSQPADLFAFNYNGVLSPRLFVEARVTKRHGISTGAGAQTQDLIKGTLMRDVTNVTRYWSPTFCGVCRDEHRDNDDVFMKGNYFFSRKGAGSHNVVFGYDTFNDIRAADSYQSGSSYRILGTNSTIRNGVVYPVLLTTGAQRTLLEYDPITLSSLGTNFRTHSVFVNDNLRWNSNVTLNLGLRYDKNHGVDSMGNLTASDSGWSPRIGVVLDPKGNGNWTVTASFAKYVAGINNSIADSASSAGVPGQFQWAYNGPAINPDPTAPNLIDTATAIQMVFNQCGRDSSGFCTNMGAPVLAQPAGVSFRFPSSLDSPNALEYAAGVSRQLGSRAAIRADYVFRDFRDFYAAFVNASTGVAVDSLGHQSDIQVIQNTNDLKRRYQGLTLQATYRVSVRTDIGGNYTLSHLWGNFDGENVASGPVTSIAFAYPEYKQASWNNPDGDLAADQRQRSRLWINYGVPKIPALTISFLQTMASGVPYGALGSVDARPYVDPAINARYITAQGGNSVNYYYTARDAFRTDAEFRTDMSATLNHSVNAGAHRLDLFVQMQLLNIFNQFQLCGCGASVFNNGGTAQLNLISTGVLSPNGTTRPNFDPFTQKPVQGVNWDFAPSFGTAQSRMALTMPREFRLNFGVRF